MEIFNFYFAIMRTTYLIGEQYPQLPVHALIGSVFLLSICFLFQGIGIYVMAKKLQFKNKFFAFVPFVNLWYIGQLVGECQFFNHRTKRIGMYAMIAQISTAVFSLLSIGAEIFLWLNHGVPQIDMQFGTAYWTGLEGLSASAFRFYSLSGDILSLFQLICGVLLFILFMTLYKKYSPSNHVSLSMLTLLVPVSRYFIVFSLRQRKAVDYEAYARARQEAYARRRQEYYNQTRNNPYGNPYGNPYNQSPYGSPYAGKNPYKRDHAPHVDSDEPFAEFSNKNAKTSKTVDADSDGFFD